MNASGGDGHGRFPTILTDEDLTAFNSRYAIVLLRDRGVAMVLDDVTGESLTYTKFKRRHGAIGSLWLQSNRSRGFPSIYHYEQDKQARGESSQPAERLELPVKNSYKPRRKPEEVTA